MAKNKHFYTDEEIDFLRKNVTGTLLRDLTVQFNNHFGTDLTYGQIRSAIKNRGLKNGLATTFRIGMEPWNKGTKGICKPNSTSFKKGSIPKNTAKVGDEAIHKADYVYVKVDEPNVWKKKHHIVYELHHGSIPDGHNIVFLDGNKRNFNIENLMAITKKENLIMNRNGLYSSDPEITKTGINISKVMAKSYERGKELS